MNTTERSHEHTYAFTNWTITVSRGVNESVSYRVTIFDEDVCFPFSSPFQSDSLSPLLSGKIADGFPKIDIPGVVNEDREDVRALVEQGVPMVQVVPPRRFED